MPFGAKPATRPTSIREVNRGASGTRTQFLCAILRCCGGAWAGAGPGHLGDLFRSTLVEGTVGEPTQQYVLNSQGDVVPLALLRCGLKVGNWWRWCNRASVRQLP
jgi:hypothetical protein